MLATRIFPYSGTNVTCGRAVGSCLAVMMYERGLTYAVKCHKLALMIAASLSL